MEHEENQSNSIRHPAVDEVAELPTDPLFPFNCRQGLVWQVE